MARRDLAESTETLNDVGSIHTSWTQNAVEQFCTMVTKPPTFACNWAVPLKYLCFWTLSAVLSGHFKHHVTENRALRSLLRQISCIHYIVLDASLSKAPVKSLFAARGSGE
ncbi:uncharacterized protein FFMR_09356 [Fusarium fujikuroi]|uniref:Uncharacterized protein n=1 Tax=Fusarium fujikuroi TaxID=5127 RepID=A0A2H3RXB8_FUSFU|nr:uncharacterized protein FFM5_03373 [Fusarium fujikuroi]SCN85021.1 uncharacterized protein FFC1_04758 [Fusarium fujikuroi]SCO34288.1 uncharacterized protein FFNC_03742 [Fusarium fujikuroi]SCO48824.1 uncharacterized protein FFMR_09356 [Fusarium fujikuroi]SCV35686.1 uncharacterized protein FFB14_05674 [Fusarium fujikuroi]